MRRTIKELVNARSAVFVTTGYFDTDDAPTTPALVRYCVLDPKEGTTIRDWTVVGAAQSVTLLIDSDDTGMKTATAAQEDRRVIVEAEFTTSKDKDVSTVDFVVVRAGTPA